MTFNRSRFRGIKAGYRSGLEEDISKVLTDAGIQFEYEVDKISYEIPARVAKYTPDFKLRKPGGFWYLETKGIWATADRAKHVLIKKQSPEIDIRFLFSNARAKLYKGSPTRYSDYCDKHGFRWAQAGRPAQIPREWLEECK
tara:strand:+ start:2835 stop:3260 length:426 start_codon:yes stop_codon:yes gene_type:complete